MPGRNIKQIRPGLVGPTTHKRVLASSTVFTMVHNQRDPTKSTPHHVVSLRTPSQTHASRTNSVAITGFAFKLFTSPVPYSLSPDSAQHLSELQVRGMFEPLHRNRHILPFLSNWQLVQKRHFKWQGTHSVLPATRLRAIRQSLAALLQQGGNQQ